MNISGLILDVHDDVNGATIKSLYPSWESIPGIIKQAHAITPEERERLPNEAFALVMRNNGEDIRKYACIDAGNTILSVQYFLKHAHKLPETAQKVAANNLVTACGWYDIQPPAKLEKIALNLSGVLSKGSAILNEAKDGLNKLVPHQSGVLGTIGKNVGIGDLGAVAGLLTLPGRVSNTIVRAKANTHRLNNAWSSVKNQGGNLSDQISHGLSTMAHQFKHGEAVGSTDMPMSPDSSLPKRVGILASTVKKTASHPLVESISIGEEKVSSDFNQVVDVTHEVVSKPTYIQKIGRRFALPAQRMYPLDSFAHVKMAAAYIDDHWDDLDLNLRREYCVNLVKRASELDIPVSSGVSDYGSSTPASLESIDLGLIMRKEAAPEDLHEFIYKLAELKEELTPVRMCALLFDFDKLAGLQDMYGVSVPDPYDTVFVEKYASNPYSEEIDGVTITEEDLKRAVSNGKDELTKMFGEDFYKEFQSDPITIFSSMPRAEKKLIISCASK